MSLPDSLRLRRKADKVRVAGWINLVITPIVGYFAPDRIAAIVMGCLWVVLVIAVTQIVAWRMDVHANRTIRDR